MRRSEEVVKQVEEQVVEEKMRNMRDVERERGELLCLADLVGEFSPSAKGCNRRKDLDLGFHKEPSLGPTQSPPARRASEKAEM